MKLICTYIQAGRKKIISVLKKIFPKVQFVFTTHSPSVLSNVSNKNVLILDNFEIYPLENMTYGKDIEAILREVMRVQVRPIGKLLFPQLIDTTSSTLFAEEYSNLLKYFNENK